MKVFHTVPGSTKSADSECYASTLGYNSPQSCRGLCVWGGRVLSGKSFIYLKWNFDSYKIKSDLNLNPNTRR